MSEGAPASTLQERHAAQHRAFGGPLASHAMKDGTDPCANAC